MWRLLMINKKVMLVLGLDENQKSLLTQLVWKDCVKFFVYVALLLEKIRKGKFCVTTFAKILMWFVMSDKEKYINLYKSHKQPLTVYHIRIVIKVVVKLFERLISLTKVGKGYEICVNFVSQLLLLSLC